MTESNAFIVCGAIDSDAPNDLPYKRGMPVFLTRNTSGVMVWTNSKREAYPFPSQVDAKSHADSVIPTNSLCWFVPSAGSVSVTEVSITSERRVLA